MFEKYNHNLDLHFVASSLIGGRDPPTDQYCKVHCIDPVALPKRKAKNPKPEIEQPDVAQSTSASSWNALGHRYPCR